MKFWRLLLLFPLVLVACGQQPQTPTEVPPTPPVVLTLPVTPTPDFAQSCRSFPAQPTPGPDEPSLFPLVTATDHSRGPEDAAITLVVYGDFQGSGEEALKPILDQLLADFPTQLRLVFRSYPQVALHDKATLAAQAAEAADLQGKFWEMYDLLLTEQANWRDLSLADFQTWLAEQAPALGMDAERFVADLQGSEVKNRLAQIVGFSMEVQLPGTPIMLINGQIYQGMYDYASLESSIRLILLGQRQFTTCPPWVLEEGKEYTATLHTEKGEVVIQLFPQQAPYTVNNFIFLARSGWYDDITFHRVLPGFIAQTGDPSGTGLGGPGYFIVNEIAPGLSFDREGMVGMANAGPNTNGSQFFITFGPAGHLDGKYTIFGQVISGMDVLRQLTPRDPQPGKWLPPGDKLLRVTIDEH